MKKTTRGAPKKSILQERAFQQPKKALEEQEKQIEEIKRKTQQSFARERACVSKQLRRVGSGSNQALHARKASSPHPFASEKDQRGNAEGPSHHPIESEKANLSNAVANFLMSATPGQQPPEKGTTAAEKQSEALKQLKFVYDVTVAMVAEAEANAKAASDKAVTFRRGSQWPSRDVTDGALSKDTSNQSLAKKKEREQERKTPTFQEHRGKRASSINPTSLAFVTKKSRKETGSSISRRGSGSSAGGTRDPYANIVPEFTGPPSPAVQLISLVKVLLLGQLLKPKEMKAVTTVLEETRNAVKAVKAGIDSEKSQERLIKHLAELLEIVTPGNDPSQQGIAAEEILFCSYLRLSKDHVERLEAALREKGIDPGIHCHSNVENANLAATIRTRKVTVEEGRTIMPLPTKKMDTTTLSISATKGGVPLEKRVARPESMQQADADENIKKKLGIKN